MWIFRNIHKQPQNFKSHPKTYFKKYLQWGNGHGERSRQRQQQMQENRKRMLDAIGKDAYNGVDLFEGTQPLPSRRGHGSVAGASVPHGSKALDGIAPNDPGVNLAALGVNPGIWKTLAGK